MPLDFFAPVLDDVPESVEPLRELIATTLGGDKRKVAPHTSDPGELLKLNKRRETSIVANFVDLYDPNINDLMKYGIEDADTSNGFRAGLQVCNKMLIPSMDGGKISHSPIVIVSSRSDDLEDAKIEFEAGPKPSANDIFVHFIGKPQNKTDHSFNVIRSLLIRRLHEIARESWMNYRYAEKTLLGELAPVTTFQDYWAISDQEMCDIFTFDSVDNFVAFKMGSQELPVNFWKERLRYLFQLKSRLVRFSDADSPDERQAFEQEWLRTPLTELGGVVPIQAMCSGELAQFYRLFAYLEGDSFV